MIVAIQVETNNAVQAIESTTFEVAAGIEVVNGAGEAFHGILSGTHEVAQQIREVSSATQHMSEGASQIVHAHFPPPAGSVFRSCIRFVTL